MSKKVKVGLLAVGLFLSMSVGAYAGANLEEINAYLNHGLKFKLNGSDWTPKDEEGNTLAPITYKETTYLPVRAVSNALQVPIDYDNDTETVLLGKKSTNESVNSFLESIDYLDTSSPGGLFNLIKDPALTTYNGTSYKEIIRSEVYNPSVGVLKLDKKYSKLVLYAGAENAVCALKVTDITKGHNNAILKDINISVNSDINTPIEIDVTDAEKIQLFVSVADVPANKDIKKGFVYFLTSSYYK